MIHTKFQGSRPLFSGKTIFELFPFISQCKTYDYWGGAVLGPWGTISTNLVDVHWVISKPYAWWFQRDFIMFTLYETIVKHVTPGT